MENKKYICQFCNKLYSSYQSKFNHITKFHKDIKKEPQNKKINDNFKCQYCNKNFTLKSSLTRHMKCRCKVKKKIINKIEKDTTSSIHVLDKPKENIDNTIITTNPEYIYLLQECEFKNNKQEIYKIGKTKQYNFRRFNDYPKDSLLILHVLCNNCDTLEKKLIELFNTKYIKRNDIGNEYFEGNYKNMLTDIYKNL